MQAPGHVKPVKALDAAEHPGTRLCALCGAAAELDPVLKGFDHTSGSED